MELNDGEKAHEIYLGYSTKKVRVPKYFYKMVYQPSTKQGIVLVTSNNPYLKNTDLDSATFCEDVCTKYNWQLKQSIERGYTFCCTMNSFRDIVKEAPQLDVVTVLAFPRTYASIYLLVLAP